MFHSGGGESMMLRRPWSRFWTPTFAFVTALGAALIAGTIGGGPVAAQETPTAGANLLPNPGFDNEHACWGASTGSPALSMRAHRLARSSLRSPPPRVIASAHSDVSSLLPAITS